MRVLKNSADNKNILEKYTVVLVSIRYDDRLANVFINSDKICEWAGLKFSERNGEQKLGHIIKCENHQ